MTALRFFARLFLALAFLASSQSALVHPLEHLDELGGFVHLHHGHSHGDESESEPLCDVLAALTACASGAVQAFAVAEQPRRCLPPKLEGAPRLAEPPPFLSQGPPASV